MHSNEAQSDQRMYATGDVTCPVEMLRLLIRKTVPKAQALFNSCVPNADRSPQNFGCWFDDKPLSKRTFTNFLPDICKASKCAARYTAHCLRATAITKMNDAGFEARHIMFMSGHRNESSIRSYNRNLSSEQKQRLSKSLSVMTNAPESDQTRPTCVVSESKSTETHKLSPQNPVKENLPKENSVASQVNQKSLNNTSSLACVQSSQLQSTQTFQTSNLSAQMGFLANSSFNNSTVNFYFK